MLLRNPMNMNILSHTCGLLLLALSLCVGVLPAQDGSVRFYIEDVSTTVDEDVEVDIRVENFMDIGGTQFSLEWNEDDLDFKSVSNLALNAGEQSSFNLSQTGNGRLGYLHFDMSLNGFDLDDGAILFTVIFDVVGENNSLFNIGFTDEPVSQVVADTDNGNLPATFDGGTVIVGNPSKVDQIIAEDARFVATPNPFQERTILRVKGLDHGPATLIAYDVAGRTVFSRTVELSGQEQFITVRGDELPAAGVFLLKLETNSGSFNRKVIFRGNGR